MKITDFGLWFCTRNGEWSATIYEKAPFHIYYDGVELGYQSSDFGLSIYIDSGYPRYVPYLHVIKLKNRLPLEGGRHYIGHPLTLDDFEIVYYEVFYENP